MVSMSRCIADRSGNKAALIERFNYYAMYIRSGSAKRLVDPDSGIHLELRLAVVYERQPPIYM